MCQQKGGEKEGGKGRIKGASSPGFTQMDGHKLDMHKLAEVQTRKFNNAIDNVNLMSTINQNVEQTSHITVSLRWGLEVPIPGYPVFLYCSGAQSSQQ